NFCALATDGRHARATSKSAEHGRPPKAAVAGALFMTWLFSAEIEAISSRHQLVCDLICAVVGASQYLSETVYARCLRTAEDPPLSKTNRTCRPGPNGGRNRYAN